MRLPQAYGAAWLASKEDVLQAGYFDMDHAEPVSFAMFENAQRALKTFDYRDMWVAHLSGLESILKGACSSFQKQRRP